MEDASQSLGDQNAYRNTNSEGQAHEFSVENEFIGNWMTGDVTLY